MAKGIIEKLVECKSLLMLVLLVCPLIFFALSLSFKAQDKNFIPQRVAHAGGAFLGLTITNSLDSLDYNYRQGFRYFEIDLSFTHDNQLVCSHSWGGGKSNHVLG